MPDPNPIPVVVEGRDVSLVLIDEDTFGTIQPAAVTGVALPFMSYDIPEKESEVDVAQTSGSPLRAPLGGQISIPLTIKHAAVIDATPWLLKHYLGAPSTSGVGDPYTHVMEVGTAVLPPGFEIEEQIGGLTLDNFRSWAGRGGALRWSVTPTGGLIFDADGQFLRQVAPSATPAVAAPTGYTSAPIDQILAVVSIDSTACGVVASLSGMLDNHLTVKYGPGNSGYPVQLSRGVPTGSGSLGVFLDDDIAADVLAAAKARTDVELTVLWQVTVAHSITWQIDALKLYLQGRPVESEQGVLANFNFRAADMTWTWVNAVASYA